MSNSLPFYRGLFGRTARRRCPHEHLTPIYGDAINAVGGWRLYCRDCGRHIDGPVSLAASRPEPGGSGPVPA